MKHENAGEVVGKADEAGNKSEADEEMGEAAAGEDEEDEDGEVDGEEGEEEQEEGEEELEENRTEENDDGNDIVGELETQLFRKKSIQALKKQMSVVSVRGGIQGNEGVIGEDGGVEGGDDDESSVDGMRTR